jgi:hypothetical protein
MDLVEEQEYAELVKIIDAYIFAEDAKIISKF